MKNTVMREKREDSSGLFILAGLFVGLGLGFIFDEVPGGTLLGLGLGFIGLAISRYFK